MEEKEVDMEALRELLDEGRKDRLTEALSDLHPADVAAFMEHLSYDDAKEVFSLLDPKVASEVIIELPDEEQESILEEMESKRVSEIVDHLASDDAADILGNLSEEDANRVLEHIPEEDTRQVKNLLSFEEDTAGGIMQAEMAAARSDATVEAVIDMLRGMKDELDDIHNVFVTDRHGKLIGTVPVRKLVLATPETPIVNLMEEDCPVAHVDQDQEEIARMFKKYDLLSLPVTDGTGRLIGRITIDDIVDVIEEEASEDFFRMAGAGADDILPKSVIRSAKARLPWLFASCIGGIVGLKIIDAYEHSLGKLVLLAAFLPVILGMGGNIGTQSTTIVVRGLATGALNVSSLWRIVFKEVRVGLLLGLVYGSFLALAATFIYPETRHLNLVVGTSMCCSMMLAAAVGTMVPIFLFKLGIDPAVATGPFVTTTIDLMGIMIFFNIATFVLF